MNNGNRHHVYLAEIHSTILIIKNVTHAQAATTVLAVCFVLVTGSGARAQTSRVEAVNMRDHIYKGNSLMQRRDYDGAIYEYEKALVIDPSNVSAKDNIVLTHNNWGIDLFHQKKYDQAREQWNTALKLNPLDRNAKNNLNVLKAQLIKLGQSPTSSSIVESNKSSAENEAKAGGAVLPKGAQTAREDDTPIPNAVIIGRPSSSSNVTSAGDAATSGAISTGTTGGGNAAAAVQIMPKSNPYESSTVPAAPSASSSTAPTQSIYSSSQANTAPAPNPDPPKAATSSALGTSNIEDKLAALETKVYGRPSRDIPILQRLERLERDTSSRASLGSINDRVQTLIKTYGL